MHCAALSTRAQNITICEPEESAEKYLRIAMSSIVLCFTDNYADEIS